MDLVGVDGRRLAGAKRPARLGFPGLAEAPDLAQLRDALALLAQIREEEGERAAGLDGVELGKRLAGELIASVRDPAGQPAAASGVQKVLEQLAEWREAP